MGDDVWELEISSERSLNLNLIKAGNIEIFSALINKDISVCWLEIDNICILSTFKYAYTQMLGDEKNQGKLLLIQDQCFLLKLV